MSSLCLRTRLQKSINNNISFCKVKIILKSSTQLANFYRFQDEIGLCLRSSIVYKFVCDRCTVTYNGKACHHFKLRVVEHLGISTLTNKRSKLQKLTAVNDHMLMCDQLVLFDNFKVLVSRNFEFHLKIKESLLISRDQPISNKMKHLYHCICLINYINISYLIWLFSYYHYSYIAIYILLFSIIKYMLQ